MQSNINRRLANLERVVPQADANRVTSIYLVAVKPNGEECEPTLFWRDPNWQGPEEEQKAIGQGDQDT